MGKNFKWDVKSVGDVTSSNIIKEMRAKERAKKPKIKEDDYRGFIFDKVREGLSKDAILAALREHEEWSKNSDFFESNVLEAIKKFIKFKRLITNQINAGRTDEQIKAYFTTNIRSFFGQYICYIKHLDELIPQVRTDLSKGAKEPELDR